MPQERDEELELFVKALRKTILEAQTIGSSTLIGYLDKAWYEVEMDRYRRGKVAEAPQAVADVPPWETA